MLRCVGGVGMNRGKIISRENSVCIKYAYPFFLLTRSIVLSCAKTWGIRTLYVRISKSTHVILFSNLILVVGLCLNFPS
jgi:hypothetical protein